MRWDARRWIQRFHAASASRDRDALHALRIEVFDSTVEAVRARSYELSGRRIDLDSRGELEALRRGTVFYGETASLTVAPPRFDAFDTQIRVVNADCLDVARGLVEPGSAPAVLNMANRRNPGGGVHGGAGAQEESLFRRSSLLWSLYQFAPYADDYGVAAHPHHTYPIPRESGGIYTPPAAVFRSSEATGYGFLDDPFHVAFVTVPAVRNPETVERDGRLRLAEPMARATLVKIRAILRIAARHGHVDLVLGAFGCGAFRNPPDHVARLFREALGESEFAGVFRRVVFAVLDDHNAFNRHNPEGNLVPFEREFGRGRAEA